jgi:hypothetical protein
VSAYTRPDACECLALRVLENDPDGCECSGAVDSLGTAIEAAVARWLAAHICISLACRCGRAMPSTRSGYETCGLCPVAELPAMTAWQPERMGWQSLAVSDDLPEDVDVA